MEDKNVRSIRPENRISPAPQVLFHGGSTTVTLNKAEGVTWTAVNGQTGATLSLPMTEETAVTYTIENIAAPIRFRPRVAAGMLRYEAMPDGWMSKLGNFDVSRQQPQQTATVRGEAVYMALPAENSHTLLPPDIDRIAVTITDANNHTMFYSFAGWKVVSAAESPVLPAGTVLTGFPVPAAVSFLLGVCVAAAVSDDSSVAETEDAAVVSESASCLLPHATAESSRQIAAEMASPA